MESAEKFADGEISIEGLEAVHEKIRFVNLTDEQRRFARGISFATCRSVENYHCTTLAAILMLNGASYEKIAQLVQHILNIPE